MPCCNGADTGSKFARHENVQTSDRYFFARESVESLKKGKQMTGIDNDLPVAPFSGKPLKDCGCVSQRVSGGNELERQKSSGGFSPVFIISSDNCNRVSLQGIAFEMLEPCALKDASTVLRGLGTGNSPRLPDFFKSVYPSVA